MSETNRNLTPDEYKQFVAEQDYNTKLIFQEEENKVRRDQITGRIVYHQEDPKEDDSKLNVTFSMERRLNKSKSAAAAAADKSKSATAVKNVYDEIPFITIIIPGRSDLSVHTPVTPYYEWRFKQEFEAWTNGTNTKTGTPLTELKQLTEDDFKALNSIGVYSVEQAATLSDSTSKAIRGFHSIRKSAQLHLSTLEGSEHGSLAMKVDAQQETIDKLTALLEKQSAMLEKFVPAAPTGKKAAATAVTE